MKAIGIARVSSKEQEDNYSIPAQRARIEEFAKLKWFEEITIHELTESSTKETRKKFQEILKEIELSDDSTAVFVETIDRLQRDYRESVALDDLRRRWKIRLYFFRENLIIDKDSNSADIMRWDIGVFVAKQYVSQLRDNVKRSITEKTAYGEWPGKAPLGYLNVNKDDNSISKKSEWRKCAKWIIPDQSRKDFIFKAFSLFSEGIYTTWTLAKKMTKLWLTTREGRYICKSTMYEILNDPFYYGQMMLKEKLYDHKYDPIIPFWLFDKCQKVFAGCNRKGYTYGKKEFIFKWLIQCKQCGNTLSQYEKKGHNYIRCHNCKAWPGKVHLREDVFIAQLGDVLKEITISEDDLQDILTLLQQNHARETGFIKNSKEVLMKEQEKLKNRFTVLYEDRLDGRITTNEYDKKVLEFKKKEVEIIEQLKSVPSNGKVFQISASYILELIQKASELFKSSQTTTKRKLLNFVFANLSATPSNLEYKIKEPFDELLFYCKLRKWLPE